MIYIGNFPSTKEFSMKPNRFLLAAISGLALAFTISCSDDDGGGTGACKYTYNSIEMCDEYSGKGASEEMKADCGDKTFYPNGGTYSDSCPKGLKCKESNDFYYYVYSDLFKDCEEFCKQQPSFNYCLKK
jgi:hypothetical protein